MPLVFDEGWNKLNLATLNKADNIAMLWLAKTRMNNHSLDRLIEYLMLICDNQSNRLSDVQRTKIRELNKDISLRRETTTTRGTERVRNPKTKELVLVDGKPITKTFSKTTREPESTFFDRGLNLRFDSLYNALQRDKVTKAILREFNINRDRFKNAGGNFDAFLEAMHNDRLRVSDSSMLSEFSAPAILLSFFDAKNKFTGDQKATQLINAACDTNTGTKPVRVTQGVHQSDNPHFDVLMPDDTKQIHVDVRFPEGKRLEISTISYIRSVAGRDEVVNVGREPAA